MTAFILAACPSAVARRRRSRRSPLVAGTGAAARQRRPQPPARRPVPRRRRARVAERDGHRRHGALRHRPRAGGLQRLRGRRQAGRHVLQPDQPADRAGAAASTPARAWRRKLPMAQEAAIGFAQAAAAAGSRRDHRLRQPRRHPAAVHQRRGRARAGDPQDVGRRLDVAVQRHLHRAEGPEEGRRQERRRDPAPGDRRAVGRRRHVEPAAVRGGARPGEAIRDGDLRDRPARRTTAARRARASRKRSSCCGSSRRKPAAGRSSRRRSPSSPSIYGQISDELSSQYTVGYTSRNRRATAPGAASSSASHRPNLAARTKQGYFAPTAR